MKSVYIHIPFCKSICTYCDFCKILLNGPFVMSYLNALIKEITSSYNNEVIDTLYIGGGTPSALNIKDLNYLMDIIKVFKKSPECEFTFECNLNDLNEEMLTILKKSGVNRLSIGIESFNDKNLKFLGRSHIYEDYLNKMELAHKLGFNNINVDLIYGIPKETISTLKSDIDKVLKGDPTHISTYSLIVEDNTIIANNNVLPIEEDLDYDMYQTIIKKLTKKGYNHYEVSNFSKIGYESLHNKNYWYNEPYYGFGLGASGYVNGIRYENTRSLTEYTKGNYTLKKDVISIEDDMYNTVMLGFRLLEGINLQEFYNKYQKNIQEVFKIDDLLKSKDLLYKDGYLMINPDKIYIMNEILVHIL